MKIGILTFEQFRGQKNLGSTKIRADWVINKWPEAERFVQGKQYDAVIYQKAYFVEHAKAFKGKKIFDICDPDFMHWGYRTKEMIEEVDVITTSTEELANAFRKFTNKPVICVPDRIDLDTIDKRKYHKGDAQWVAWYGYSHNFDMLKPVVPTLKRLGLDLMVISDGAFAPGTGYQDVHVRNIKFNWESIQQDLLDADIVVNPQSKQGKWKYKSNNKTVMAWALGLPVSDDIETLKLFINEEERRKEQVKRLIEVKDLWEVSKSVDQYKEILSSL